MRQPDSHHLRCGCASPGVACAVPVAFLETRPSSPTVLSHRANFVPYKLASLSEPCWHLVRQRCPVLPLSFSGYCLRRSSPPHPPQHHPTPPPTHLHLSPPQR